MAMHVLVIDGLNLDRAWPEEGPGVGPRLRATSLATLVESIQLTLDHGADALVILGGLWDSTTVRASTVDQVRTLLEAVPVPIVIVPSQEEAESGFKPQSLTGWPERVHWVDPGQWTIAQCDAGQIAAHGPGSGPFREESPETLAIFTTSTAPLPGLVPVVRPQSQRPTDAVDGDALEAGPSFEVGALVAGSGTGRRAALLLNLDDTASEEPVEFSSSLGQVRVLDLGPYDETRDLVDALDSLVSACEPLDRIEVSGRVGSRVLLPPVLQWAPARDDVTVRWQDLDFVFPTAEERDQSVMAQLIRRLAGPGPDTRLRHQTLAVALTELRSSEEESA